MDTLIQTFYSTVEHIQANVYWIAFSYFLLSEFGVPIPMPGNIVLLASGYILGQAGVFPLGLIVLCTFAVVPGAVVLYWVGRRGGEPILRRWGPRLGLSEQRRQRIRHWLERRAIIGLVIVRLLPTVRVGTTLLPGAMGMPWPRYMLAMGTSLITWVSVYTCAGYGLALWGTPGLIALPILILLGGGLTYWYRRRLSSESPEHTIEVNS